MSRIRAELKNPVGEKNAGGEGQPTHQMAMKQNDSHLWKHQHGPGENQTGDEVQTGLIYCVVMS